MKRAGLLLLVAAVLGILWIASRGRRASGSSGAEREAVRERSEPAQAALEARKQPGDPDREAESSVSPTEAPDASTSIRIRSSVGLPLEFAEIQEGDEPWKRRDLNEGRCELGGVALPCRLRAPGHAPASVERLGGEIVLEPDALLVIEAPGLRGCVESIEPYRYFLGPRNPDAAEFRTRLSRAWTWAFVGEDRWAIAVTSRLVADNLPGRKLEVTVEWHDRRRAEVVFEVSPGSRATWSTSCASDVGTAPLELTLVWPEGVAAGETMLNLWQIREHGMAPGEHLDFPWGTIDVSPPANAWIERRLEPGTEHVSLGPFPKGARCGLYAIDSTSGAYGGMQFEHDGSPRTLEMRPPLAISGRIVVPSSVLPPVRALFSWKYLGPDQGRYDWTGAVRGFPIGSDGVFEVRGLNSVPVERTANLDPPSTLDLEIRAPGFERYERSYSTGGARRFDCGAIELVPSLPQLVLTPGSSPEERSLEYGKLSISGHPEIEWVVLSARKEPDGSLSIFLDRDPEGEKQAYRCWIETSGESLQPFPSSPGEFALLVDSTGEHGVGLRVRADRRYEAVATRKCRLEIDCRSLPSGRDAWVLGWRWQGMSIACSRVAAEFDGERTEIDLELPEDGVTLWWSGDGRRPETTSGAAGDGGTMPATGSPIRLTLP